MRVSSPFQRDVDDAALGIAATPGTPKIAQSRAQSLAAPLGAAALVAGPLAMLAFHLLNGSTLPRDDAREYLEQIASLGNRFPAATIAYMVAAAFNLGIGLAIIRLLGRRPSGVIAGSFLMLAALGSFGFGGMNLLLWGFVREVGVTDDLVRGYAAFQDGLGFMLLAAIAFPAAIISTIALLVGLFRSRVSPLWVPALIIVGFVAGSGEFGRGGNIGGALIAVVAGIGLAQALLRMEQPV
jgi:hypothetical protein